MTKMNETDKIFSALKNIQPYERIVYYSGLPHNHRLNQDSKKIVDYAYQLSEAGKVMLFQRKIASPVNLSQFDYIAVGAPEAYTNYVTLKAAGRIG